METLRGEECILIPTHQGELQVRPFPPLKMQLRKEAGGACPQLCLYKPCIIYCRSSNSEVWRLQSLGAWRRSWSRRWNASVVSR